MLQVWPDFQSNRNVFLGTTFANHQPPSRGLDWYFGFQGPGEGTWLDNIDLYSVLISLLMDRITQVDFL